MTIQMEEIFSSYPFVHHILSMKIKIIHKSKINALLLFSGNSPSKSSRGSFEYKQKLTNNFVPPLF